MEEKVVYESGVRSIAQTWTVNMLHVGMVGDLVKRGIAKNASEAARMLIEAGYKTLNGERMSDEK